MESRQEEGTLVSPFRLMEPITDVRISLRGFLLKCIRCRLAGLLVSP